MLSSIIFILIGLVLLAVGAEGLVRGSSSVALRLGVTPLVVGLTIVAFGTGSPELVVSVGSERQQRTRARQRDRLERSEHFSGFGNYCADPADPDGRGTHDRSGVMLGSALLLNVLLGRKFILDRVEGTILIIGYVIYVYSLIPS